MPSKSEWLTVYRNDHPELGNIDDDKLWSAIQEDHKLLPTGNMVDGNNYQLANPYSNNKPQPANYDPYNAPQQSAGIKAPSEAGKTAFNVAATGAAIAGIASKFTPLLENWNNQAGLGVLNKAMDIPKYITPDSFDRPSLAMQEALASSTEAEVSNNFKLNNLMNSLKGSMGTFSGAVLPPNLADLAARMSVVRQHLEGTNLGA